VTPIRSEQVGDLRCEIGYPYTPRRDGKSAEAIEKRILKSAPSGKRVRKNLKTKEFNKRGSGA